ncbi:hypothetical protein HZA98_00560, partial [Candidatus Woesearchaeota archaeon]|nr:hypothetical protein [Candidatus Woesearchaeota archaeon]
WSSAAPALIEALKRFEKQVLHVRATLNPFLDDRESGVVRNMKLKTAQDNIYKTIDSLNELSKSRQGRSEELNRIIKKETMRWNECAKQIGMRLNGEINAMEFKDYMNALDKGFQNAKNELRERFSH